MYKSQRITNGISAIIILIFVLAHTVQGQHAEPSITFNPRSYYCYKTAAPLKADGKLTEASWEQVRWTEDFVDIEGKTAPRPRFNTKVKMLWDNQNFYIAARLEEPHIWATLTERDAVLFHENNFEVFIDPDGDTHHYYELEVNALGTYWDLMLTKPYRDGGKAIDAWDIRGLKVGINIEGSLNEPADRDSSWTVELAIPWKVLEEAAPKGRRPMSGEIWRVNFSRVQWQIKTENGKYVKQSNNEDNWVWSPQGIVNMHYPEMWGFVQFASDTARNSQKSEVAVSLGRQSEEQIKWYLRKLYYRQYTYHEKNGVFTEKLQRLKEREIRKQMTDLEFGKWLKPEINATDHTFELFIEHRESGKRWYIREDGKIWQI